MGRVHDEGVSNNGTASDTERRAWQRVWQHIDARRIDLGWSLETLYAETGVSEGTYGKMRRAGDKVHGIDKIRGITDGLHWSPDSIDRILAGKAPRAIAAQEATLHQRVAQMERSGADIQRRIGALERSQAETAGLVRELEELVKRLIDQLSNEDS